MWGAVFATRIASLEVVNYLPPCRHTRRCDIKLVSDRIKAQVVNVTAANIHLSQF